MAKITVHYRSPLKELTGTDKESLDATVVKDVLKHIKTKYGADTQKQAKSMLIAIDGDSILLHKGFATQLQPGETVQFLPICGGG